MQRRTKLILLIIVAILLFGVGIYLLVSPYFAQKRAERPLDSSAQTELPPSGNGDQKTQDRPIVTSTSTQATAPNPLRVLEHRAKAVVERIGSGTNVDGFLGYRDALLDMTQTERGTILAEQKKLLDEHPVSAGRYGILTRVAASHITQGNIGDAQILVTVDAIRSVDAGLPSSPTTQKAKRFVVTFAKQSDGSYLVENLTSSDVQL